MKITGETFSLHHKRKGAEEVRYQKYLNFQVKSQNKRVISLFFLFDFFLYNIILKKFNKTTYDF